MQFKVFTLKVTVYDKRKNFPFKVVRYPNMWSSIPTSLPYGVFTGQLHRFYRICSTPRAFLATSIDVLRTMYDQGCEYMKLFQTFSRFIYSKCPLRWSMRPSVLANTLKGLFYETELDFLPFT